MNILVTGNAGFIGGQLTDALLEQGHQVVGLDKRSNNPKASKTACIVGNILDRECALQAMKGCELVCHLAAEHQDWGISRREYFRVNQEGTKVLLSCATELGIKRFVFFSSVAVYGTSLSPTTERTTPRPDNDYGESKLAAEGEIERWTAKSREMSATIIRPTVVFGEGMNDYSNIYRLVSQIANRRFLFIGKMNNVKSLAYVGNLVEATLFLIARQTTGFTVYNYAEPDHLTSREIVDTIASHLAVRLPGFSLPLGPSLLFASVLDIAAGHTGINFPVTKARIKKINTSSHHLAEKILHAGFKPRVTNEQALKKTCAWFLKARK